MTAQTPERLLYLGEDVAMCSEPLEDYFAAGAARPKFDGLCSALWRGYVGSWEINHDLLYLVGIDTTAVGGTKDCLAAVFPNCDGRVFAEWYSGTIRIPQGELLEYVHGGYESTYEIDVLLHIERGVVVATEKHRNGTSDATRLVEDGNQDPARNAPALRLSEPHTSYNREEFTDSLLQALVGEGLDVWVKPDFWPTDGGEYSFSSLDGARYADQWLLQTYT